MRRRLIANCIVGCTIAAAFAVAPAETIQAASEPGYGGAKFDVSAQIGGRYADPVGIWTNPCDDTQSFESKRLADDVHSRAPVRTRSDGVMEKKWQTLCRNADGTIDATSILEFWIADVTPGDIVLDLMEILPAYLDPPEVSWPNMSPEHGWLFVKVPMDFRIENLRPVTVTATVTNSLGTATASATATPGTVNFVSGEGGSTSCSATEATQEYVPGVYGACSYEYQNSSSIAGGAFASTTTMVWDIVSTPADPTIPVSLVTFAGQALAVSEVQAVVTCVGAGC